MKLICHTLTQVQPGREHSVKLTATVVSSSGIGDILPKARDCFFTNEGSLEFYEKYTLTNCRLECGIKQAEKVHGCIPWHLPKVTNYAKTCASPFMPREKTQPPAILGRQGLSSNTLRIRSTTARTAFLIAKSPHIRLLSPHQCLGDH